MTALLQELLLIIVIAASACIAVRWLVPIALRLVLDILEDAVAFVAALLLLPEYWLSTTIRERQDSPPQVAYEYSAAVAGVARHLQLALRRICRGLAVAAHAAHPVLVAAIAVGLHLVLLLS